MLKEKTVVKCIVLSQSLCDKLKALADRAAQGNQSKVIRKILDKYFENLII